MKYRTYYHKGDINKQYGTEFFKYNNGAYECTHGGWTGYTQEGDELTLWDSKQASEYIVIYNSYEEHDDMILGQDYS